MKLLLDTHTLLWSIGNTEELSIDVVKAIKDVRNEVLVSAISLWEIALKHSIGKLRIEALDITDIPQHCNQMGFELIPLTAYEALNSFRLPQKNAHKDPFDRMLIHQCIQNHYVFVSKDSKIVAYKEDGLKYIW